MATSMLSRAGLLDREGWRALIRIHPSVLKMYLFYVVPMSVIPPAMVYYAGIRYGGDLLPAVSRPELISMCVLFFLVELVVVPAMGLVIQQLGDVIDVRPPYQDAFTLAAVAPTPLWLAPLLLFVPSVLLNLAAGALAMLLAAVLIFRGVDPVFKLDEPGHAILMAGAIFAAGLVAWIGMILLTLVAWGYVVA